MDCKGILDPKTMLQSRSACIFKYLDSEKNSSTLTLPIILSFVKNKELVRRVVGNSDRVKIKYLLGVNKKWNSDMDKKELDYIVDNIDVKCVRMGKNISSEFTETYNSILFLEEIMGVIDKKNFVERGDYYIKNNRIENIDKKKDILCKNDRKCSNVNCINRTTSKGGKECINKQRYRTDEYYILNDTIYRLLCKSKIVSGYSGIFRHYTKDNIPTDKYTIVFPFFGEKIVDLFRGFNAFYLNGYITRVLCKNKRHVGIIKGLYDAVNSWYKTCQTVLEAIPKKSTIYIVGCSLGGALSNIVSFLLLEKGYKNIHMYALGSPRVGDEDFREYINNSNLSYDSANYIRFNNILSKKTFYTQFDPVIKFPVRKSHKLFANNGRMRCMASGITFNPLNMIDNQPDYEMFSFSKSFPVDRKCKKLWYYVHSIPAYGHAFFADIGKNAEIFDRVIDKEKEKC